MKFNKIVLTSGIVLFTTVMLTGCGKVNVNIYDKESEFKVNNVANEEVVNEATNEVINKAATEENKQVQNTVKEDKKNQENNKITNEEYKSNEERDNNTLIEYSGEIATIDSNVENPSFASSKYTAYVQNTGSTVKKLNSIDVEVTYKVRELVKIHIDDITDEGGEGAAGTIMERFSFRGTTENGYVVTGKGELYYSSVVDSDRIYLSMEYDQDIFGGVNISTNKRFELGSQETIYNEP